MTSAYANILPGNEASGDSVASVSNWQVKSHLPIGFVGRTVNRPRNGTGPSPSSEPSPNVTLFISALFGADDASALEYQTCGFEYVSVRPEANRTLSEPESAGAAGSLLAKQAPNRTLFEMRAPGDRSGSTRRGPYSVRKIALQQPCPA